MKIEEYDVPGESQYVPLTDKEITAYAKGIYQNTYFPSWWIKEHDLHLIQTIFLPLALLTSIQYKELKRDGLCHMLGDYNETVGRSINGYPCFMSCKTIDNADGIRIQEKLNQIIELMENM